LKLGLISDVHADIEALNRALEHLQALQVDTILCAGDIVGYGPTPAETVARIAECKIPCVRGNHDRWAIDRGAAVIDPYGVGPLSQVTLEWLGNLPPVRIVELASRLVIVTHGTPGNDMEYLTPQRFQASDLEAMLADLESDLLVVGHTHEPMWFRCARGAIVNPGSLYSAPSRLRSSRTFAVVEMESLTVRFYDVETGSPANVEVWDATVHRG
jgi:putative phosphoesterase